MSSSDGKGTSIMTRVSSACFITVSQDGPSVSITDAEGYGEVSRVFRTIEEANLCYTFTVQQLLTFRDNLMSKGWELDELHTYEYES